MNRIKQYLHDCAVCGTPVFPYAHKNPDGEDFFFDGEILPVPLCSKECLEHYKLAPILYE